MGGERWGWLEAAGPGFEPPCGIQRLGAVATRGEERGSAGREHLQVGAEVRVSERVSVSVEGERGGKGSGRACSSVEVHFHEPLNQLGYSTSAVSRVK